MTCAREDVTQKMRLEVLDPRARKVCACDTCEVRCSVYIVPTAFQDHCLRRQCPDSLVLTWSTDVLQHLELDICALVRGGLRSSHLDIVKSTQTITGSAAKADRSVVPILRSRTNGLAHRALSKPTDRPRTLAARLLRITRLIRREDHSME